MRVGGWAGGEGRSAGERREGGRARARGAGGGGVCEEEGASAAVEEALWPLPMAAAGVYGGASRVGGGVEEGV